MCDQPNCAYREDDKKVSSGQTKDNAGSYGNDDQVKFYNDPVFNKKEWNVQDWEEMYDKLPEDTCSGNYSYLSDYADHILLNEPLRVFLPLCGGSSDLRSLYDRGNTVVGIDAIEKPVLKFFRENADLEYTVEEIPQGKLYKSKDERLMIYIGDITKIEPSILGKFSAVVDCGSYTAIIPADRHKYVQLVTAVLDTNYRYFLEVCHDAPPNATGLPNSVPFSQVKKDFGPSSKLTFLQTKDISEEWSVETFFQTFILISPK